MQAHRYTLPQPRWFRWGLVGLVLGGPCAGMKAMEKDLRRGFARAMREAPTCMGSSPEVRTSVSARVRRRERPRRLFANVSYGVNQRQHGRSGDRGDTYEEER